jgi:hypothetical protein
LASTPHTTVEDTESQTAIFSPCRSSRVCASESAGTTRMLRSMLYLPKTVAGRPVSCSRSGTSKDAIETMSA